MTRHRTGLACAASVAAAGALAAPASADVIGATFERPLFTPNDVHEQQGWLNPRHNDVRVVENDKLFPGISAFFGAQSLQMSNRVARDPVLDQTLSPSLIDAAGETTSDGAGFSGGVRQPRLDIRFQFSAAVPDFQQDLHINVSPTRGDARVVGGSSDGSRMGKLVLRDEADGLAVDYEDVDAAGVAHLRQIVSGLSRSMPHSVHQVIAFNEGAANDVVETYIDGTLVDSGTTWESAYRAAGAGVPTTDGLMFAMDGPVNDALHHEGFLIDDVRLGSEGNPAEQGQQGQTGATGTAGTAGSTTIIQQQAAAPASASAVLGSTKKKVFSVLLSNLSVRLGRHPMARVTAKCPTKAVLCDGVLRVFTKGNKVAVRRAYALTSGQRVRMNIPLSPLTVKKILASKTRIVKVSAYTRDRDGTIVRASLSRKARLK